jgi:hypothetical protein
MDNKKFLKKILFILLCILGAFIPLYPKFPLFNVPGTYVAIRAEDFLIAISIGVWLIYIFIYKRIILTNFYFRLFLLFWAVGLVSLTSALYITDSVIPHLGFLHWARRIEFMFLFWLAAVCVKTDKQIKYLLWIFIGTTLLVLFYGFGQIFLGFKVVSTIDKDFSTGILTSLSTSGRVNSTFAGHYDLSIYLSYFLIIMTGVFFTVKKIWMKAGVLILSAFSFVLLGFAASRISFAATIAGMILVLYLINKKIMILWIVITSIVLLLTIPQLRDRAAATLSVNILGRVEKSYTPNPEKISKASEEEIAKHKAEQGLPIDISAGESTNYTELEVGRSIDIRLKNEWPRANDAIRKNLLLGTGYSSLSLATDNDYLRSLGETGVLGFVSLLTIFAALAGKFTGEIKNKNLFSKIVYVVVLAVFLDAAITAIFIDILEASKAAGLLWMISGAAYGYSSNKV